MLSKLSEMELEVDVMLVGSSSSPSSFLSIVLYFASNFSAASTSLLLLNGYFFGSGFLVNSFFPSRFIFEYPLLDLVGNFSIETFKVFFADFDFVSSVISSSDSGFPVFKFLSLSEISSALSFVSVFDTFNCFLESSELDRDSLFLFPSGTSSSFFSFLDRLFLSAFSMFVSSLSLCSANDFSIMS